MLIIDSHRYYSKQEKVFVLIFTIIYLFLIRYETKVLNNHDLTELRF
jgi:hypothetical protein